MRNILLTIYLFSPVLGYLCSDIQSLYRTDCCSQAPSEQITHGNGSPCPWKVNSVNFTYTTVVTMANAETLAERITDGFGNTMKTALGSMLLSELPELPTGCEEFPTNS